MARGKRRRGRGKHRGKRVTGASFGKRKFGCYGKRVKTGKGSKRVPRVFCSREDK